MTDYHLIVFLDNQNLGIDTKIGFLNVYGFKTIGYLIFLQLC